MSSGRPRPSGTRSTEPPRSDAATPRVTMPTRPGPPPAELGYNQSARLSFGSNPNQDDATVSSYGPAGSGVPSRPASRGGAPAPGTDGDRLLTSFPQRLQMGQRVPGFEDIDFVRLMTMNHTNAALYANQPHSRVRIFVHFGRTEGRMQRRFAASAVLVARDGNWAMLYSGDDADTATIALERLLLKSMERLGDVYH